MNRRAMTAEQHAAQAALVREMIELLHDLLCSRINRGDVAAWVDRVWPKGEGGPSPFDQNGTAYSVLLSISGIGRDEQEGNEAVREQELKAYIRWLSQGRAFFGDDAPFMTLPGTLSDLSLPTWVEPPVRFWMSGLGWFEVLQLASTATDRAYFVLHSLSTQFDVAQVWFTKRADDDLQAAAFDLFESLAIDERDTLYLDPKVDLSQLGCWELWRLDDNNNEALIESFHSRAKAVRAQQRFEARGHRQTYWVAKATARSEQLG